MLHGRRGTSSVSSASRDLLRAVDRDQDAAVRVRRNLARSPCVCEARGTRTHPEAARSAEHHHAVLAELDEREVHGEQRAERIAVGVLVRGDERTARAPGARRRPRRYQRPVLIRSSSSASSAGAGSGRRSASSSCTPCSTADRMTNRSWGSAQLELAVDARLQDARRPLERAQGLLAAASRSRRRSPRPCVLEIARRLDGGHGDEADARILERRDRLGDDTPSTASSTRRMRRSERGQGLSHRGRRRARARAGRYSWPDEPALGSRRAAARPPPLRA